MEEESSQPKFERLPKEVQSLFHKELIVSTSNDTEYVQTIKAVRIFLSGNKRYFANTNRAQFFIENLAQAYCKDPVMIAAHLGTQGALDWLKSYSAISGSHAKHASALFIDAAANGDINALIGFLKAGVSVDATDTQKNTALIRVAQTSNPDDMVRASKIAQWLIEHHASINLRNKEWSSALLEAARHNNTNLVHLLLEYKAEPNVQGGFNNGTPLHWAVSFDNLLMVQDLFKHGLQANVIGRQDLMHMTPLDIARNKSLARIKDELVKRQK